jgi:acetyl-CoA carboxylase biotin carboxyl carrier protein
MSYFFKEDCNNLDTLKTLVELVSQNGLGRLEVSEGDLTVKIEGKHCPPKPPHHQPGAPCPPPPYVPPMPPMPPMPPVPTGEEPSARVPQPRCQTVVYGAAKVEASAPTGKVVKAPIVGTFYASPSPDKPPYVRVGDTVKKGDVIMIIESMKLMNEVNSEYDGVVKEVLVENGSPVEYDQPIMVIE